MDYSFAVFGPQGTAPSVSYLESVSQYIGQHPVLKNIKEEIKTLQDILTITSNENADIAALPQAPTYMEYLFEWLLHNKAGRLADVPSTIIALPRLCIIHIVQYFQFLESHNISHTKFLDHVNATGGGFQGYCGGMPATVALASAREDEHLTRNIITTIRLAFAIGLYAELGDDSRIPGLAILVIRVGCEEQAHELISRFPNTYISAFTDPRNISVVGSNDSLCALNEYATSQGFTVQPLEIRGKVHNPENIHLAHELTRLIAKSDLLRLPDADQLQCPARSNRDGNVIAPGCSLSEDVLYTVLASRSEWYKVLEGVAKALTQTGDKFHKCISLGIGDFIPLLPFNKTGLRVKKTEWSGTEAVNFGSNMGAYEYLDDAIAIVGSSCRLPGASNLMELWELVSRGQDLHEEVPAARANIYESFRARQSGNFAKSRKWYGNFVHGVEHFDRAFFGMNPRETANMDPQQRILLEVAFEAMESYGYTKYHVRSDGDNIGCFIGASFTEYLENAYAHEPTAYTAPGTIRAFLCGRISYHFGWTGPSEVIDTACSASLVAVSRAVKAIRGGECPVAIAGGVNLISGVHNYLDLARAGFLSPTGQCKPWDKDADGYCRSDGIGLVVLKSLRQAQADGDRIMGVIAGACTNQGGLSSSITNPDPVQQARLYRDVLSQAAMGHEQVTYVEAHGTGTQAGDLLETTSLREIFGSPTRAHELTVGSIKGNIGHCETAAGIAGLLKVLSMLEYGAIPPQANHKTWNPKIPVLEPDKMTISKGLKAWNVPFRSALINSFGAAGSNATIICCEAPKRAVHDQRGQSSQIGMKLPIVLSARSATSLQAFKRTLSEHLYKSLRTERPPYIDEVAYTLSERRGRHKHLMVFETNDVLELAGMLVNRAEAPVLNACEKKPIVLVFGGQSKRTIGLAKGLYEQFERFRSYLNLCSDYLLHKGHSPIFPAVFQSDESVTDIVALQTGHVAVQYAASKTWLDACLEVAAVIGHSLGELSALAISGTLSIYDTLDLVAQRATFMQTLWGPDKGSMTAVFASRHVVQDTLAELKRMSAYQLEIACYNSETNHVVSGDTQAIVAFEKILKDRCIKNVRLDTSHGFHSRLIEPITQKLDEFAAQLDWHEPVIPIEICTQAHGSAISKYIPSAHARQPVFFSNAVQRLEAKLGPSIWLEAGFETAIMGMLRRALIRPVQNEVVASGTNYFVLAASLISDIVAKLWQSCIPVTHWLFLSQETTPSPVWLPPYCFDRTSAWVKNIDRTSEMRHLLDNHASSSETTQRNTCHTPRLVIPLTETDKDRQSGVMRFRVVTDSVRFRTIVAGHAVRGRALCPASVYIEVAIIAAQHVLGAEVVQKLGFTCEELDISAPLGLDSAQRVECTLCELPASQGTQYKFCIVSQKTNSKQWVSHAQGRLVISSQSSSVILHTMARLAESNLKSIEYDSGAERLLAGRVYKLFSRVVDYGEALRGISDLTLSDTEAVANVEISSVGRPGVSESTVLATCDAVVLDAFIQVAGLNINASNMVSANEAMICNGIGSSMVSMEVDFRHCDRYRVYATFSETADNRAIADVFAWSAEGQVAAAFLGCRFTRLSIRRLEKLLDDVNNTLLRQIAAIQNESQYAKTNAVPDSGYSSHGPVSRQGEFAKKDLTGTVAKPTDMDVRTLLETYTGLASADIESEAVISQLGVDSLAATELAGRISTSKTVPITANELLAMTVEQLQKQLEAPEAAIQTVIESPEITKSIKNVPLGQPSKRLLASSSTKDFSEPVSHVMQATEAKSGHGLMGNSTKVMDLLVELTGLSASLINPTSTLSELGVDSLALTELLAALQNASEASFDLNTITITSRVESILNLI